MKKPIALISIATFVLVVTLGLGSGIAPHKSNAMPECDTMQTQSAMCPLSAQERLGKWQELSVMVAQSFNASLVALFALALVITWPFFLGTKKDPGLFAHVPLGPPLQNRLRVAKIKNPIEQALSQGLLNPHLD